MMGKTQKLIVSIVILTIAVAGSFFLGKSTQSVQQLPLLSPIFSSSAGSNQLFRSQTATFQGEITKVNKDSLDVATDAGVTGNFKLSNKVYIYKFKKGVTQATSSTDLNSIEVAKRVLIILELSKDQYKVVSISYQPPPVTPPPAGGQTQKK